MKLIDQFKFVENYWIDRDPDPKTPENELLMEFSDRVKSPLAPGACKNPFINIRALFVATPVITVPFV